MAKPLMINGMTIDEVYDNVVAAGINAQDASLLVSDYIAQVILGGKRNFNYVTTFPGEEPDCAVDFVRTFVHGDWVDGESVVQAEETASEQGFNKRFHAIEHDLDSLGAAVGKISLCMAEMRSSLRSLLDEIKSELNRLEATMVQPPVTKVPPSVLVKSPPMYIGTTKYFDHDVHVWETESGIITLPSLDPVASGGMQNIRVQRVQALAEITALDQDLAKAIAAGATKQELVKSFGDVQAPGGQTFANLIDILPDTAKYESAAALVTDVGAFEARALRTTPSGTDAIIATLGTDQFADASLDKLGMLPAGAVSALTAEGIDTVGKLAEAAPERIAKIAQVKAPGVTGADAAGWAATASMLTGLGPQR
jgi:predicted SnoaL-like aldol condensation-catalyzing enzyme